MKTAIVMDGLETESMSMKLPNGIVLTVEPTNDPDYPGFWIKADGEIFVTAEYHEGNGLRSFVYPKDRDDAVAIINYETGADEA